MEPSKEIQKFFVEQTQRSPEYRSLLLADAAQNILHGELQLAREKIKIAVHSSVGFESLGKKLGKSPKSLPRSFGPGGNPLQKPDCGVTALHDFLDVSLKVKAVPRDDSAA